MCEGACPEFYCLGKGGVCVGLPDGRCSAVCPDAVDLWGLWNQEIQSHLLAPCFKGVSVAGGTSLVA